MKRDANEKEERYEIIVKKFGGNDPVETNVMGDRETMEVLRLIGKLNLRSAFAS